MSEVRIGLNDGAPIGVFWTASKGDPEFGELRIAGPDGTVRLEGDAHTLVSFARSFLAAAADLHDHLHPRGPAAVDLPDAALDSWRPRGDPRNN